MAKGYVGWALPDIERWRLNLLIPAVYPRAIMHHVTLAFGVDETYPLPLKLPANIIGMADDGTGVQCAIVEIGGVCDRPDGSVFHITWSLADGRKAVESNALAQRWRKLDNTLDLSRQWIFHTPEPIELVPTFFPL